ncbi:electron transport complex subunit RsxC [Thiorhodococcus mannitoliphagus]|uniref:Ion-translocating oxidoreductase complex subunit C n=1 Tax=Thiorhodococcus mannitoliphagus TaxID=329406 RepID=A0A6P1DT13_9GAMM|nr:electron transport complex subunit RsxC [Thiorhodococcus mannitoliphagus]NEX19826.1 electron transport complex subunit RsxC [Thiorhodococcus mannitoliphagus]
MSIVHLLSGKRRLWKFHGGIHVPDEKALSNACAIATMPLPKRLVIPLQQHIGAPARPLIKVGDGVLKGQTIAEPSGFISAPVHASSSGTVVAIESHPVAHPSGLSAVCAIIEPDGKDAWSELPPPLPDYPQLDPALIRERIRWAGVVGMGGAAFPTAVKLSPGIERTIQTLVINGAECEPYITCDDRLMRERAAHILEGVRIMHHLLGVAEVLIGIEDNKPEAIAAMRLALADTDMGSYTEVVSIPTLYPSGGEKQLIRILTGKEVPTKGIPAQVGIVCQNVGSAAAVADAVLEGKPLISRVITVTGRAIKHPRNLEVPIGTRAEDLIAHCDGYQEAPRKLVCGGPMMGFELKQPSVPVTKSTNCLLALTAVESPDPEPALACIRCGRCAEACPAKLLPQQMYWYARSKDLDRIQDYNLFDCIECGCCAQVCPSHIPLVQYYRYAKTEIWAREQERKKSELARTRHAARQARLERQEKERQARLRKQKAALAAKQPDGAEGADTKKAAIEAARQRAAAKKAATQTQAT